MVIGFSLIRNMVIGQVWFGTYAGSGFLKVAVDDDSWNGGPITMRPAYSLGFECYQKPESATGFRMALAYATQDFEVHYYSGGFGGGTSTDLAVRGRALHLEAGPRFWIGNQGHLDLALSTGGFLWAHALGSIATSSSGAWHSTAYDNADVRSTFGHIDLRLVGGMGGMVKLDPKWSLTLDGRMSIGLNSWLPDARTRILTGLLVLGVSRQLDRKPVKLPPPKA